MNLRHKNLVFTVRCLLGLAFLATAAYLAFWFDPTSYAYTGMAKAFLQAAYDIKYIFWMEGIVFTIAGLLLLTNRAPAFALVIAAPFVVNWLLFHGFLAFENLAGSFIATPMMVYLAWVYWPKYKPLFQN